VKAKEINAFKVCRDETRNVLVSTPSEECDLEPLEECRMETVLVPRLVEKPKCLKVPREVCVNQRINPKKLYRPVIKEWCYKPSQFQVAPDKRYIRQFINKNSIFWLYLKVNLIFSKHICTYLVKYLFM